MNMDRPPSSPPVGADASSRPGPEVLLQPSASLPQGKVTSAGTPKIEIRELSFYYGKYKALHEISLDIHERQVTAFIGPSGCGKSTLLRTLNRIYELYPGQRATGRIQIGDKNLLDRADDVNKVRARIGMVFQKPTPFPMSVQDNVAFGVRLYEQLSLGDLAARVEWALQKAALWDEVKDKLTTSGLGLSGGQQQRLCVARGIAVEPEVLLLDEPASALDPISTAKLEDTIIELKRDYTIVIVTHNLQQAARVADHTGFMFLGRMIEFGPTQDLFINPKAKRTADYVGGRFG